jgi:hypothetical protein
MAHRLLGIEVAMKRERPDVAFPRLTLHHYPPPPPRPPAPTFDPISATLRLPFAPPRPTDPPVALLSAPSVPEIEFNANQMDVETVVLRRPVRRGPWMLLGALGAVAIIACFALVGRQVERRAPQAAVVHAPSSPR